MSVPRFDPFSGTTGNAELDAYLKDMARKLNLLQREGKRDTVSQVGQVKAVTPTAGTENIIVAPTVQAIDSGSQTVTLAGVQTITLNKTAPSATYIPWVNHVFSAADGGLIVQPLAPNMAPFTTESRTTTQFTVTTENNTGTIFWSIVKGENG